MYQHTEVSLEMVDGKPYFTAHLTGDPFTGDRVWHLPYIAHKTLVDANSEEVTEHCFLVKTRDWGEENVTGPTYSIFLIEKYRVIKHNFDDRVILNNWDFAYRYFVDEFGCGSVHHVKTDGVDKNLISTDTFC